MTDSKEEVKRDDLGETPDPLGRSCSALLSDSLPLPSSTFFNAKPGTFPHELMQLINKHSIENGSNTPDHGEPLAAIPCSVLVGRFY